MSLLKPQPPFVWPEPRALERIGSYEQQPPFGEMALQAHALFGITTALTTRGIDVLKSWLSGNLTLKVSLVVVVYPTCATQQADLSQLLDLVHANSNRLSIHVYALEFLTDRASNALCFLPEKAESVRFTTGPSEDLGTELRQDGHANLVFRADPALVEGFKRYFDWLWAKSPELSVAGVAQIPELVIPDGTEEAVRMWRSYMAGEADLDPLPTTARVDPETGDVTIFSETGEEVTPSSEALGLPKLDQLAEQVTRLYEKGALVSIDKLSRIPPLDAPLDPSVFGDKAELQRGNIVRKVTMRVSIIDKETLKEIEKRRKGLPTLLTKLTYGLANNMRWIPNAARELFDAEMKRINRDGQDLIANLLEGDVSAFIEAKRAELTIDVNTMYVELGGKGKLTNEAIEQIVKSLKKRLDKADSANFMPMISYSTLSFSRTETASASPWGPAFSLLADIAKFPREALSDPFFFRGFQLKEDDLLSAMNVAYDALLRDTKERAVIDRSKRELVLISPIERAPIEARTRCELVSRLIAGHSIDEIGAALNKVESE